MAHIHGVFDSDTHFVIDPITRQLKNETSKKASVVQFDHDSERFTFELPRIIEGHDMTTCNVVQVHYLNIEAKTKIENKGLYEVDDLQISPEDENTVICSWLISQNATQLDGSISFLVRFSCVTEGEPKYIWQTAPYTAITVTTGINNSDYVVEEYADIIEQWREELFEAANLNVEWDNIKNKPFGDEGEFYDRVTFDGSIDENAVVSSSFSHHGTDMFFVKVGELPCSSAEYLSKVSSIVMVQGTQNIVDLADTYIVNDENKTILKLNLGDTPLIVAIDNLDESSELATFPETGVYFVMVNANMYVESAAFDFVTKVAEKFMPESYAELKKAIEILGVKIENATPKDYDSLKSEFASLKNSFEKLTVTKNIEGKVDELQGSVSEIRSTLSNIKGSVEVLQRDSAQYMINVPVGVEGSFMRTINGTWRASYIPKAEDGEY